MTVTRVKLHRKGPLKKRTDGSRHASIEYIVVSDSVDESQEVILANALIPQTHVTQHPDNSALICREVEVDELDDNDYRWIVTAEFDTKTDTEETPPDDPLTELVRAGFRAQDRQVPAYFDAFGRPNVNTAGDIIEGLVRTANEYVAPVTLNLQNVPLYLFTLNNTLNAGTVTFRGINFPAGTLMLKNMAMPDRPETGNNGTQYWPLTFDLIHNPDGFYELHPNRGKHELVYQTRASASGEWTDGSYATYDGKTPTTDRRIIKRRIETDEQQAIAGDIWLDRYGQAVRVPTLTTTQIGTGSMTANSTTLTAGSSVFVAADHTGASVSVSGAGPHGRILRTRIASVSSGTVAVLDDAASETVSGRAIYLPGVICKRIINQPLADWSSVPLPNNDPA